MSKAFTRENDSAPEDDDEEGASTLPAGTKNYMTPAGHARLNWSRWSSRASMTGWSVPSAITAPSRMRPWT